MTNCKYCGGVDAKQRCAGCLSVFYCSKNCQVSDWKGGHKTECKPYEVKRNEKLGRYMIASRDLKAGEILFREFPVAHGPKMISGVMCLGCHKRLPMKTSKSDFYRCSKCAWPVCSKHCEALSPHIEECNLMATVNYKCPIKTNCAIEQSEAIYCLIFPLRFLLLKRNQPKIFERIHSELESHVDDRIASGSYNTLKLHLVPFIHKLLGSDNYPERLILTACAILDNNCFEILLPSRSIEMGGLYLISLILCHDCVPNTKHYVNYIEADNDSQRYQMTFETTVPVRKGEHLTTTYIDTLKPTLVRRLNLKQTKIFDCDCRRCGDPSELSTYGSSWICEKCSGIIVSSNPLDNKSDWRCENCKATQSHEEIASKLNRLQTQLNGFIRKCPEQLEQFILEHSRNVHSNHFIMLEVKYMLCLMYGNVTGYRYQELPEKLLMRKLQLCENILEIYNAIDPGRTNQRTNVVFELNCAKIIDARHKLNRNLITRTVAETVIDECLKAIRHSYDILIRETESKSIMVGRLQKILNESFI